MSFKGQLGQCNLLSHNLWWDNPKTKNDIKQVPGKYGLIGLGHCDLLRYILPLA